MGTAVQLEARRGTATNHICKLWIAAFAVWSVQNVFTAVVGLLSNHLSWGSGMPIRPLLQQHSFGPDEVNILVRAFEEALQELRLVDRNDPIANLVAKRLIELAQSGERDPVQLREGAVKGI